MIRRPPRSTQSRSSAASDVYKRQVSTQSTGAVILSGVCTSIDMPESVTRAAKWWASLLATGVRVCCDVKVVLSAFGVAIVDVPSYCQVGLKPVSYTHLRAHETVLDLVCRLLLEKKKKKKKI
eukprot:TRINITY_DN14183_c0_g1_i3.p1 TRINITY_DN14183_c0_g1~~TRINITY_DN14183_c0_g1_i3.p1  ORF type:complete len:123 (+),score=72.89 TRINITY_DN14183_c0_g1_i3:103-471(+)